jgi:hypothetical protein
MVSLAGSEVESHEGIKGFGRGEGANHQVR